MRVCLLFEVDNSLLRQAEEEQHPCDDDERHHETQAGVRDPLHRSSARDRMRRRIRNLRLDRITPSSRHGESCAEVSMIDNNVADTQGECPCFDTDSSLEYLVVSLTRGVILDSSETDVLSVSEGRGGTYDDCTARVVECSPDCLSACTATKWTERVKDLPPKAVPIRRWSATSRCSAISEISSGPSQDLRSGDELITPARLENTRATIGWTEVKPRSEHAVIHSRGARAT